MKPPMKHPTQHIISVYKAVAHAIKAEPVKKPIEIMGFLDNVSERFNESVAIENYTYITLIAKNYATMSSVAEGKDLILVHNHEDPSYASRDTILCIGNWNDGVVG